MQSTDRAILPVKRHLSPDASGLSSLGNATNAPGVHFQPTSTPHLFSIDLPPRFFQKQHPEEPIPSLVLQINYVTLHQSEPLPKAVAQKEEMFLHWTGDAVPLAFYGANKARTKIRTSTPKILSHSLSPATASSPKAENADSEATKSGAAITYGPWVSVPSFSDSPSLALESRRAASVHYKHDAPVISVVRADRHVEISHWGDNLAIDDQLWLRNDGPKLKGHFSRIEHQMAQMYNRDNSHTLNSLLLHLPPGAKDAYFVDAIGNISTSHFRPTPNAPQYIHTAPHKLAAHRASSLDLVPRYPLLGGWNFTFSIGYHLNLAKGSWGKRVLVDGQERYSVAVPFLTPITDVAVDSARTTIVLPEGAKDITYAAPFLLDSVAQSIYTTYLDSTGRPSLVLERKACSDHHGRNVFVTYKLDKKDHYRKPAVITAVFFAAFLGAALARRFEARIKT
ncbi:Ribophorin I [Ceraceosorus guamensis]|uniref:Dolichyl-diphosphooligosaccharide--protein glycosyltransferase subunit 1 n=1 Tax=Ceraceosorus guamensis TaxID=1522189 RepID=A0A316VPN1_9BASI|nr:Ribophorin I [Ceraceosorus guamensis]PWN39536.1 Ribophorin I [Ceraceosorus guamensis]